MGAVFCDPSTEKNTLYRSESGKFSPLFTASGINTGLCLSAKTDVFGQGDKKQGPGRVSDHQRDIGSISVPEWHHKGHISFSMYFTKHILSSWWKDGHPFIHASKAHLQAGRNYCSLQNKIPNHKITTTLETQRDRGGGEMRILSANSKPHRGIQPIEKGANLAGLEPRRVAFCVG